MADERPPASSLIHSLLRGQDPAPTASRPVESSAPEPSDQLPTDPVPTVNYVDQGVINVPLQPQPEYLMAEWIADSRVHRPRTREYYSSLAVIVLLLSLILFFAGQTLLIFVLLAFLFVSFVLASTKPIAVVNQLTTYGIRYQGKLYYWSQLGRFWVRDNHGTAEIHVEAPTFIGNELILLPSNSQSPVLVTADDISEVLRLYLVNEAPPMTQVDRWVRWLEDKFPLEKR